MEDTFEKFSSMTSCDNVSHDFVLFLLKKTLNIAHNQNLQNVLDNAPGIFGKPQNYKESHLESSNLLSRHLGFLA